MQVDLLITGDVATLAGPAGPRRADSPVAVESGWAVAVRGDRITWVGPAEEWDGPAKRRIDATGRLVTPGYVDPHCHLVYGGDRAAELALKLQGVSYMDILARGGGIMETVRATRAAGRDGLVMQATARARRMLAQGTTSLEAKSGYGLEQQAELTMLDAARATGQALGISVVPTFLGAHAVPPGTTADQYTDAVIDMLPAVGRQGIARFCDAFVEKGVFTPEHGARIFDAARREGLGLRLHADEIVNTGGAELAARAGCVCADHLLRVSDAGLEAMADAGTMAVLMPTVPITLMRPEWAPGKKFIEAGIPIALGTDHNPNNPVTSMSLVAQLGCYMLGLTPEAALLGVTHNAAASLGIDDQVGSLAVGHRADILVHDVPDLAHWVVEPGRDTVSTVVSGGRVWMER